jgi:electron transport complex protein RnfC
MSSGPMVLSTQPTGAAAIELPCIRCGFCAEACPVRLQPQQLLWHLRAENLGRAANDGLEACSECGLCEVACPSHIPLLAIFGDGKKSLAAKGRLAEQAEAARLRFEARGKRLLRESVERAEREQARKQSMAAPDAIAAALARARARREANAADKNE